MNSWPAAIRDYGRQRLALFAVCAVVAVLLMAGRTITHAPNHAAALARYLADTEQLDVETDSVRWIGQSKPHARFLKTPTLFLASTNDGLRDVYYAELNRGSGGAVWSVGRLRNLTRSSSADEQHLEVAGASAAYLAKVGNAYTGITVLDLAGEDSSLTADWPLHAKVQNAITNYQEEGRVRGFGRTRYQFEPPAHPQELELAAHADTLMLSVAGQSTALAPGGAGRALARLQRQPTAKAQPGMITWLVDTVRNTPGVGAAPIEWLEHRVFGIKDLFERVYYTVFASNSAEEAASDLGIPQTRRQLFTAPDPELGFPPAALKPPIAPPIKGEGQWMAVDEDPFVNQFPNAPPAFYQTFVRADPERKFTRVYITLWDPRQVQLHIAMGTREPESATGETGTGMIPRDEHTLQTLVAGFNGGFQALHGEYGMMADGRVYLPPKPWAATVAVFNDGSVGMGSWPPPPGDERSYDPSAATEQIPDDMIAMRQNLTSVVEDGKWNPWERWWWGAAPVHADEQTYIDRSGICLTEGGFMAFFWGQSMGAEALGTAMLAARCVRGMHLDMNSKHTGFEFYKVSPKGGLPPLAAPIDEDDEARAEMPLPHADGYVVRSRKAVRAMATMRFPRYIRRDPRDFFYLTLKPVLPGPDATSEQGKPIRFETSGLPHAGWPHALARACMPVGNGRCTWAVRIDPRRAVAQPLASNQTHGKTLAVFNGIAAKPQNNSSFGLVAEPALIGWRLRIAAPTGNRRLLIAGKKVTDATARGGRALGVDPHGFVVYVQQDPEDRLPLAQRLRQLQVSEAMALPRAASLLFRTASGAVTVSGNPEKDDSAAPGLAFVADTAAPARVLYEDNEPLPYHRWGYAQGRRVRYFPKGPPRFRAPGVE